MYSLISAVVISTQSISVKLSGPENSGLRFFIGSFYFMDYTEIKKKFKCLRLSLFLQYTDSRFVVVNESSVPSSAQRHNSDLFSNLDIKS